jgi:hypothetical protein
MTTKRVQRANTRHIAGMLAMATQADIAEGLAWYQEAGSFAERLGKSYGITTDQAAGVLAAISPKMGWRQNCIVGEAMIDAYKAGLDAMAVPGPGLPAMRRKAVAILRLDADEATPAAIASILSGPKITAFYRNITGSTDDVTVDGHAYAVWKGERITTTETPSIGKALRASISRAYRLVADRSEAICGEALTPCQVQAVTWVTYRRIHGVDRY